jgi:SAM-dependent methyltransferase
MAHKKEWFAEWFDSKYYHTLYKSHDEQEAKAAVDNLLRALALSPGARVLDLACGKGRHSRYLAAQGFDVTGLDISSASIRFARQFEQEQLHFYQHDMRLPFRHNYFDATMNMFTSFGYFDTDEDHQRTLHVIAKGLRTGGLLLLDFFNSHWVRANIVPSDTKVVDGITFQLEKRIADGHVYKSVRFEAEGRPFEFRERVRLFDLSDFERMFERAGLVLRQCYGGYDLRPYEAQTSKRLILIAEKNSHATT